MLLKSANQVSSKTVTQKEKAVCWIENGIHSKKVAKVCRYPSARCFLHESERPMITQLLRFAVAAFSWLGVPLVVVGALEPEESSEFNGQRSQSLDCKHMMEECLMSVISEEGR